MINNLINLWYSFATTNIPTFNGFEIEKSTPEKAQCLRIMSSEDFKMEELANFGNVDFWMKIEEILKNHQRTSDEL